MSKKTLNIKSTCKTLAAGLVLGACLTVVPADNAKADGFSDWLAQPTMTGNWGGVRTSLAKEGIDFHGTYLGQYGQDVSGGKARGGDYAQQITIGADWNVQKLFGGPAGGVLHTYVEDRAGRSLETDYTGSRIQSNGVYGSGENFRLLELAYEQSLYNKRLNLIGGYFVLSTEFAFTPLLCNSNFTTNALCGHPQFLGQNTGYQLGPIADWGGRFRFYPIPSTYIAAGIFEVNPIYANSNKGFDLNLEHATGYMIPLEIGYTTSLGPNKLVGHYKIGGIYDSSTVKDARYTTVERTGRYDGWIIVDQMVYRAAPGSARTITLFGEAGVGDQRTAVEDSWLAAGFVFRGIIPSRTDDSLNFGWVHATTNPRAIKAEETILARARNLDPNLEPFQEDFELGYNIAVAHWATLTPDLQYFVNPGSVTYQHYKNAFIADVQAKIVF